MAPASTPRELNAGCRAQELEAKRLIPPGQHFYRKAAGGAGGSGSVGGGGGNGSGVGAGSLGLGLSGGVHRDTQEHVAVPRGFLHVYDLPPRFNEDIKELPTQWHPEQYDIDQARSVMCRQQSLEAAPERRTNSVADTFSDMVL